MKKLIYFLLIVLTAVFYDLLICYIILNVGELLHIGFITNFSLIQWFGIIFACNLIFKQDLKNEEDPSTEKVIAILIIKILGALLSWGLVYVTANILMSLL